MLTSNAMAVFADHFDAHITTHNHYVHAYSHSNSVIVLHACYYNDSEHIGDVRFGYCCPRAVNIPNVSFT